MRTIADKTTVPKNYWSLSDNEVYSALGTEENGLSEDEAGKRLKIYGLNEFQGKAVSRTSVFIRQFNNAIFVILILCAIITGFLGEFDQSAIILLIMALSVVLGFYNEYRAEKIVDELRHKVSAKAVVIRDGRETEVDANTLVPGDIVSIYIGSIVPADMKLIDSKELEANEAYLTGEAFPADKRAGALKLDHPAPHDLTNCLFMGTSIAHGSGKGVVIATGKNTEFGAIAGSLARPHPVTEFQKGVKSYGNMLMTLTCVLVVAIFLLNTLIGHPFFDSLLFSLAVAVGLVPELMPAIVTISLSHGASRMAQKKVVVKRLVSIEDFGNMDVLCTDKTGTLTEGNISMKDYWLLNDERDARIAIYSTLCNSGATMEGAKGNAMDLAIWKYADENRLQESLKAYKRIDEVPFDYQRRMMSVAVRRGRELAFITKGAPESVLPRCRYADVKGKKEAFARFKKQIGSELAKFSEAGYRVIAVAYKDATERKDYGVGDETKLIFLGLLIFTDPPKRDANDAIATLNKMGVDVKILTGDNELVAKKVCEDLEVSVKKVVCGSDIAKMSWVQLKEAVEETTIFARITPQQKLDVIKALKENKHVVGFMGDGVNDAPALYESDVGISVNTAVDVAKDAADIVLLEKSLRVIADGVQEGRMTFENTLKYILMGTSSNFGNMFSAATASLFLPFLPMLPVQILFMNMLYDTSNMTLPTDNVDKEFIRKPKKWDINFVRKYTLFFGPFSSVYDFLTFGIMLFIFIAPMHLNLANPQQLKVAAGLFQSGWFVESFWTEVLIIFVIRTRKVPFFSSRPGKWLTLLTLSLVAFGTILPLTPFGSFLGFVPLPIGYWGLLVLMTATYLLLVDMGKVFFYKTCGNL
jgi:Mg2+-importing ATPase